MANIPSIDVLIQGVENEEALIERLNLHNTNKKKPENAFLAYKLMRYILATNRSSIRRLKPEEAVGFP